MWEKVVNAPTAFGVSRVQKFIVRLRFFSHGKTQFSFCVGELDHLKAEIGIKLGECLVRTKLGNRGTCKGFKRYSLVSYLVRTHFFRLCSKVAKVKKKFCERLKTILGEHPFFFFFFLVGGRR